MRLKISVVAVAAVVLVFGVAGISFAAQRGTSEYQRLVELKKTQRAVREAKRESDQSASSPKPKGFWQKEAERSGFAGTAAMIGNGVDRLVPGDGSGAAKTK